MLVLLLKPITFIVITTWSIITRLIFNTIAYTIVLFLQGIKSSGEGTLGIFQQIAEIIRACFEFILQLIIDSMVSLISSMFDVLKDIITGSVASTGSMAAEVAEKLKNSLEEGLKMLPEMLEEIGGMVVNMGIEVWNNYKVAVGYVTENS